ncbi:PREDICTED: uncharacterized protein LOC109117196 [Tarenaya hassleriana]|uniref:uncharacterized protein LOC109117196 n=1 Tax=Tarenaya hassleriana TaxID=28532 RepID=UPI0008FD5D8D|nr:PREDICTED: uncharacterized protein LOC109117196 [Tarenaya hassleriana]
MEGNHNFPIPPVGKYYLGDSGYALRPGFLTPYRGERYHPDQYSTSRQPTSYKEMFNKKHSSLRSVIERTFGIWKAKWRVLKEKPRYNIRVQQKVVAATMALHNFIRLSNLQDIDFEIEPVEESDATNEDDSSDDENDEENHNDASIRYMEGIRDEIAATLWDSRC